MRRTIPLLDRHVRIDDHGGGLVLAVEGLDGVTVQISSATRVFDTTFRHRACIA